MRRILILVLLVPIYSYSAFSASKVDPKLYGAPEGQVCIKCHELKTPGLLKLWRSGKMDRPGLTVSTVTRLRKKRTQHRETRMDTIIEASGLRPWSVPKTVPAATRSSSISKQVSHHAKAADILNSSDNYLGTVVGGPAAVNSGCRQCHGSNIKVLQDGNWTPVRGPIPE